MRLATIISYCTNDYRFIDKCIAEARKFSQQIVIAVCDHFFNGTPENRLLLEHTYARNPDCLFVEFAYSPTQLYASHSTIRPEDDAWVPSWHAAARYIGTLYLDSKIDTLLFLDSDEIVEGDRFIDQYPFEEVNADRILGYYYILRPNYRATNLQNVALLIRRSTHPHFFNPGERFALFHSAPSPKRIDVLGKDGLPLIHHYSWVRPKEECLQKAATWGHSQDQDWPTLIEEAFSGEKKSNLFGSISYVGIDLQYTQIDNPYFDPLSVEIPREPVRVREGLFDHVIKVDRRAILKKELELFCGL